MHYPSSGSGAQPLGSSPEFGASETGGQLREKARELKEQAKDKGQEAGRFAKEKAEQFIETGKDELANQISQVAQAFRRTGENLRDENQGALSGATEGVVTRVERLSDYLRTHRVNEMVADLEGFARQRPALFLGGAFTLGLIAARFFKPPRAQSFGEAGYVGAQFEQPWQPYETQNAPYGTEQYPPAPYSSESQQYGTGQTESQPAAQPGYPSGEPAYPESFGARR
jgi:gas vesicle protein